MAVEPNVMRVKRSVRPPPPQPGAFRTEKFVALALLIMFLVSGFSVMAPPIFSDGVRLDVVVVVVVVEVVVVVDVVNGGV